MPVESQLAAMRAALADWYRSNARALPWRAPPGCNARPDPYRVWLSEIMLQQTTVAAVAPYFVKFTARWPTLADLAAADPGDVLAAWAGLGYYSRARNLIACAAAVVRDHGGAFPVDEVALRALPGIGDYTAAAIAGIAFGIADAVPVDANINGWWRGCSRLPRLCPRAEPKSVPPPERSGRPTARAATSRKR